MNPTRLGLGIKYSWPDPIRRSVASRKKRRQKLSSLERPVHVEVEHSIAPSLVQLGVAGMNLARIDQDHIASLQISASSTGREKTPSLVDDSHRKSGMGMRTITCIRIERAAAFDKRQPGDPPKRRCIGIRTTSAARQYLHAAVSSKAAASASRLARRPLCKNIKGSPRFLMSRRRFGRGGGTNLIGQHSNFQLTGVG